MRSNFESVAHDQIRAFIERIERLEEERSSIAKDIAEVYAEAKGNGFDRKALKIIVTKRRQDPTVRMELEALVELYETALGMRSPDDDDNDNVVPLTRARAPARAHAEIIEEFDAETGEVLNEIPVSHTPEQPAGVDLGTPDGAASAGETANHSATEGGQDDHGGFYVGRTDGEQHDAAPVSGAVGRGEGQDGVDQGQGAGASEPDRDLRVVARTEHREDQDRGSRHVGGEAHHGVAPTEPDAALRPQMGGHQTLVDQSTAARKDVQHRRDTGHKYRGDSAPVSAPTVDASQAPAGTQAPPVDTNLTLDNTEGHSEPDAAMLPQTGGDQTPVASSPAVDAAGGPSKDGAYSSSAGTECEVDRQPISDISKPNPICRDPDDCGVYASWHLPCEKCKAAAAHRSAA